MRAGRSRSASFSGQPLAPFSPRPPAARRKAPSLVDVVLDPAQQAAVERPPGRAVLVLGEAGHGKTTVALHRLAYLWRARAQSSASRRIPRVAVVVPTDGLARLLQPSLRRLGVDVEAQTYDRWASAQARRTFRRLPPESESTPPSVMMLKRHPALRLALDERATHPAGRIDDDGDAPVVRGRALATRGDLQHLFGDRLLLERVASRGGLAARVVDDTLERTRIQFTKTAEEEWAHVTDRRRLVAVDRRALDDATASECAHSIDVEDYAVLFDLDRARAAGAGRPPALKPQYDVLMIDEAQELAPLELALLGRTLRTGGTLVVAGDAHQQTNETATFTGWDTVLRELGCPDAERVTLDIGYRCPPDVVALAHAILDPGGAPAGARAPLHVFGDPPALFEWVARGLGRGGSGSCCGAINELPWPSSVARRALRAPSSRRCSRAKCRLASSSTGAFFRAACR
jgi:hypothetical protein